MHGSRPDAVCQPSGDEGAGRPDEALLVAKGVVEHQGRLARAFDAVHTVDRDVQVGSLDGVVPARRLRPSLIAALRDAR